MSTRRFGKLEIIGGAMVLGLIVVAIFAPLLAPNTPPPVSRRDCHACASVLDGCIHGVASTTAMRSMSPSRTSMLFGA